MRAARPLVTAPAVALSVIGAGVVLAAAPAGAQGAATASAVRAPAVPSVSRAAAPICTVPVLKRPVVNPLTGTTTRVLGQTVAVKVSNTVTRAANSRPQSGLNSADQVWVQEVEAGRTRFMAVYASQYPFKVGPVRSGRETDLQLLPVFGRSGIAYAGSAPAVQNLFVAASSQRRILDLGKSAKVGGKPIRDLSAAMRYSQRNTYYFDAARPTTVNFYVNTCLLRRWAAVGKATLPRSVGFVFSPVLAAGAKPATTVDVRWSASSTARFVFSRKAGKYVIYFDRFTPQGLLVDRPSKAPVTADNVVVMRVQAKPSQYVDEPLPNGVTLSVPISQTVGSGRVYVMRNGVRYTGTWSRASATSPFVLRDSKKRVITLKPGRTWVALLPPDTPAMSGIPGDFRSVSAR